jgi:hypothetical protein
MTTTLMKGSCLCGGVQYEVPLHSISDRIAHCHCVDCRKFHGAAFSTFGETSKLKFTKGNAKLVTFTTPNGAQRQFCRTCGSSLTFRGKNQGTFEFSLATLEDTTSISTLRLQPNAHVFYNSKVPWIETAVCTAGDMGNNLPKYSRGRESERIVKESAGRIFGGAREKLTEARVKELIDSGLKKDLNLADLEKRMDAKLQSLAQTIAEYGSSSTILGQQSATHPNPTTVAVLHGTRNHGVLSRLPSDYHFPNSSTYDCFVQWNVGNSERQIPPLRTLFPKEFQFIDNMPKTESEKKDQRGGASKGNRRPARKTYADMKFLCNYIEAKASEAGVDTSDRSLENVRKMFDSAANELSHTGGTQRLGQSKSDQVKWNTMVQRLRKKLQKQGGTG